MRQYSKSITNAVTNQNVSISIGDELNLINKLTRKSHKTIIVNSIVQRFGDMYAGVYLNGETSINNFHVEVLSTNN